MENKYSVLMTVYCKDNPDFFRLALESMVNQTVKPDEIVLVKDGKITQELQEVINDAQKVSKNIVELQLEKNVGLGLALNAGIAICKNELIARMDSDDISLPQRCEKQLNVFNNNPDIDIVGCPVIEFSGNVVNVVGKRDVPLKNKEIHKYAKRRDPFNHPTVMYKKSKVQEVGGYGDYRKNQDTDLWIKMLSNGSKAENIEEHLLMFRFDENTYKKRKSWTNTKLLIKIRKNAYKIGFSSLSDFIFVTGLQIAIFIMPINLQRFIYRKFLRK